MISNPKKVQQAAPPPTVRLPITEDFKLPLWFKSASAKEICSALNTIANIMPILKGDTHQTSNQASSVREQEARTREEQLRKQEKSMHSIVSTVQQQLSDIKTIMSTRVNEIQVERDSALAETKALMQRVEITSYRLTTTADIVDTLKTAGYGIEEGETLCVKRENFTIGIGPSPLPAASVDASIVISTQNAVTRLEFATDRTGRQRLPIAHLTTKPSADALLFVVGFVFDFLSNVDQFSNLHGMTDEEKVTINDHFQALTGYMKETFELYTQQSDHIAGLNLNLVQLRAQAMIWYRLSKKTYATIPWSNTEIILPFEAAYEHAIGRKWNNCTAAKVDLIERGMSKDAAQLAIEREATPSADGSCDKRQRTK